MKGLLDADHVRALADEESVRGVLVRKILNEAENAAEQDLQLLEKALYLLLERFQTMGGWES